MNGSTLVWLIAPALLLSACSVHSDAPSPPASALANPNKGSIMSPNAAVRQQVQVDTSGNKVVLRVTVENATATSVFVHKAVFEDDQIFRREFQIVSTAGGAEVDYIGPMVKRGPFTRDDYVAVAPGARLANSIDITRSYDFKPGIAYQLRFAGVYLGDLARLDAASSVAVTPVTFTLPGQ